MTRLLPIATLLAAVVAPAQTHHESPTVPGRLIVVYRNGATPLTADTLAATTGAHIHAHLRTLGVTTLEAPDEASTLRRLSARPEVAAVLHDRLITAHALQFPVQQASVPGVSVTTPPRPPYVGLPILHGGPVSLNLAASDSYYATPQSWAVQSAGGFGANTPGGPSTGPWNTTMAAGVRIAILDSGIDANHPDLRPNLALNLSEVDHTALPSPCDDATPQDQHGHGTWVASLAAAAIGPGTGLTIGVAPQATLLNIKVLQRMPDVTGSCTNGTTGGLLSWVLEGIQAAIDNHASVISLSLGTLVDTTTGDGAGWQAQFNRITYAAQQAGIVIVAAVGNDSLNLSGNLIELPAQSRGVLPVVASTNPSCAENLAPNATCAPGPTTRASYSNFAVLGAIAAPGGSLPEGLDPNGISGFIRGACSTTACFSLGGQPYIQAYGTSAAAPLVAGAAAILRAANPAWTPAQIITALQSTATPIPTVPEPELNLPAALTLIPVP